MGKQVKKDTTINYYKTFSINKKKSLEGNLADFLKSYVRANRHVPSNDCLPVFHRFIKKCVNYLHGVSQQSLVKTNQMIRICQKCDGWIHVKEKYFQCYKCEDNYHSSCLKDKSSFQQLKMCQTCFQIIEQGLQKNQEQKEIFEENQKNKCQTCKDKSEKKKKAMKSLRKCLKCQKLYHLKCFGQAKVVCSECDKQIYEAVNKEKFLYKEAPKQITLIQSFNRSGSKNMKIEQNKQDKIMNEDTMCILQSNRKLRHNFREMKQQTISFYKTQLLYAIMAKNMEYSEQLHPHNCDLFACTQESFDFTVPILNNADLKIYDKHKQQPIGPLTLIFHEDIGYDVVADADILKGTLICEYVGDVFKNREEIALGLNDSRMELKRGKNADETLLVAPRKYSNIARFINGINPQERQKQNVQSTRCYIRGKPAVLLLAKREIKKGESLRYDYNAGCANSGYDTSGFK